MPRPPPTQGLGLRFPGRPGGVAVPRTIGGRPGGLLLPERSVEVLGRVVDRKGREVDKLCAVLRTFMECVQTLFCCCSCMVRNRNRNRTKTDRFYGNIRGILLSSSPTIRRTSTEPPIERSGKVHWQPFRTFGRTCSGPVSLQVRKHNICDSRRTF